MTKRIKTTRQAREIRAGIEMIRILYEPMPNSERALCVALTNFWYGIASRLEKRAARREVARLSEKAAR